jgi:hypothetical protein
MRWNALIAVFVVILALVELSIDATAYLDPDHHGFLGYGDMLFAATSVIGLALSYPLLRARNWARVALIVTLCCCAVGVILLVPFSFIANHWIYTRVLISLSGAFTLCVIIFVIAVLLHPDVRRAFHPTV